MPFFFGNTYDSNFMVMDRYLYLGKSIPEVAINAVTQPRLVFEHLLVPLKIEFVFQLLVALVFIPVVGGDVFAICLPTLVYLLIADYPPQNSIRFHYTAPIIPFLYFAFVVGLERLTKLRQWSVNFKMILATLILAASIANYIFQSAGPLAIGFDPSQYVQTQQVALGYQLLEQIPPDVPVMAQANMVPHLSERQCVYQAPEISDLRPLEYLLADGTFESRELGVTWKNALTSPYFETLVRTC